MNEQRVDKCERAISKILNRQTKLIIQPDGLPNKEWSRDVGALMTLKLLSIKYHLE